MLDKHFVGFDLTGFSDNGAQKPISRVTLLMDNENYLTAGDDSGMTLEADCPHATQAMVNAILASVKGKTYKMFSAENARFDPAAELGDGVTAGRVYSILSRLQDDGNIFPGITAPGQAELEDEYPAGGPMTQEFNRKISETRSQIEKTAEEIRLSVKRVENDLEQFGTEFTIRLDGITSRVSDAEGNISTLNQTATSLESKINGFTGDFSKIEQKINSISLQVKGSLGDEASIILSVGDEEFDESLDLSNVRRSFANDNSSVTINAGRITFNSGTFVLNSGNIQIDKDGNLTTENGTIKGATISGTNITGGTIKGGAISGGEISATKITGTEISGSNITGGIIEGSEIKALFLETGADNQLNRIEYGRLAYYYIGSEIAELTLIGGGASGGMGMSIALEPSCSFMSWATRGSSSGGTTTYNPRIIYNQNNDTFYVYCNNYSSYKLQLGNTSNEVYGEIYYTGNAEDNNKSLIISCQNAISLSAQDGTVDVSAESLSIGNTPIIADSDVRLKTNIEESDIDALSIINSVNTYSFDWIQSGEHRNLGFISQQLEADASADFVQYDEQDDAYRVKEMSFIPYLVKAVQQLYNMIAPQPYSIAKTRGNRWTDKYSELEKEAYVAKQEEIRKRRETFVPPEPVYLDGRSDINGIEGKDRDAETT